MKRAILVLLIVVISNYAFSQRLVREKYYSNGLKDTIAYRVWLPIDYSPTKVYPIIYTVEDTEDQLLAGALNFYNKAGLAPESIVVGIINGRGLIDFDFNFGKPNEKGALFLTELTDHLMPSIEKRYHASKFRAFMGHSYSSTYGTYLFLQHPGLFTGYMLFAPEAWWEDEKKPLFELNAVDNDYYNHHPSIFYLASGGLDLDRRRKYAARIAQKINALDSSQCSFKYNSVPGADHISVVLSGLAEGLAHLFKPYYVLNNTDSVANPLAFFEAMRNQLENIYGIQLEKNNRNINTFVHIAIASKDKMAMDAIVDYFSDDNTKGVDLFNMAYGCMQVNDIEKARGLFWRCIKKSEKDELNTAQGKFNLIMAYRSLAYNTYRNDNKAAWDVLQTALSDRLFKDNLLMHYYAGKLAVDRVYRLQDGLQQLLFYAKTNINAGAESWGIYPETVNFNIGKCYVLLNKKAEAKVYLQKTLTINPNNKEATDWIQKCN